MPEARVSQRAEKAVVRESMRALGFGTGQIAVEFARRYKLRPRQAWREALGWTLTRAAEEINAYAGRTGLDPAGLCPVSGSHLSEAESWPGQGAREAGRRPRPPLLALLAAAYGASVADLIDLADRERVPAGELLVLEMYSQASPVTVRHPAAAHSGSPTPPGDPHDKSAAPATPSALLAPPTAGEQPDAILELLGKAVSLAPLRGALAAYPSSRGVAYRGGQEPFADSWIEREVTMAANEGSERAERAESREIGDATLEQLRADVIRLSRDYLTGEPLAMFLHMRRVRDRIYAALDRRVWPRDASDLYLLAGALSGLMAGAANNLGYSQAAEELIRAGWAYATIIDHRPLLAWLRMDAAYTAYWAGRPRQSLALAQRALVYLSEGENAAQSHLFRSLATARLGDAETARHAIAAASDAREQDHTDDLLEIGGEFGFSRAAQRYYAGFTLNEIPDGATDATAELEQATALYAAGPGPGEHHSHRLRMLAHTDLAIARLRTGELDVALSDLEPVLALAPGSRTALQVRRLTVLRAELASSRYQGSSLATELDQRIEEFGRDTIAAALGDLPAGPG